MVKDRGREYGTLKMVGDGVSFGGEAQFALDSENALWDLNYYYSKYEPWGRDNGDGDAAGEETVH